MSPIAGGGRRPSDARAIAALVLGLLGVLSSPLLVGAAMGLLALVFGALHLRASTRARWMAISGLILGLIGIAGSLGAFMAYRHLYVKYGSRLRAFGGSGRSAHRAWVGKPAPPLSFTTLDGNAVDLEQLRGRPVIVNFWATWCGPCRRELPHLNRLARESDVVVLCLSEEPEPLLRTFAAKNPFDARVASVPSAPAPYDDVTSIPTNVFIDRQGVIRDVRVGALSYEVLLSTALAEGVPADSR